MSGVGFLVKTFTPSGRRRRRCEKQQHKLELPGYGSQYHHQPDVVPFWDTAVPITPPAMFLPPGYKRSAAPPSGEGKDLRLVCKFIDKGSSDVLCCGILGKFLWRGDNLMDEFIYEMIFRSRYYRND